MKKIISISLAIIAAAVFALSCKNAENEQARQEQATTMDMNVRIISDNLTADGVREISVVPSNVCSTRIDISVKDGIILNVRYTNGCSGNTQGVAALVKGMTVDEAVKRLDGIDCAGKGTSCPDQLARALKYILL